MGCNSVPCHEEEFAVEMMETKYKQLFKFQSNVELL